MSYKDANQNRAYRRVYQASYRLAHQEELSTYQRAWRIAHAEEIAAYNRSWNEAHPDYMPTYRKAHVGEITTYKAAYDASHQDRGKVYRATHKEKIVISNAAYRTTHKDQRAVGQATYRSAHQDEVTAYHAAYRRAHLQERAACQRKRDALKLGATIGTIDLEAIKVRDRMRCCICGRKVAMKDFSLDHTIPLSLGGSHTQENLRVAHLRHNIQRGAGRLSVQMVLF